jgi:hypothetical protein
MKRDKAIDSYIIDTYKKPDTGTYLASAITFHGKRRMEVIQWGHRQFHTQQEADNFVRQHFVPLGLREVENEGAFYPINPLRY